MRFSVCIAVLLVPTILMGTACGPASVDALCLNVAQTQCELCYECAEDAAPSGADLCRLDADDAAEEDCVDALADRCGAQSATLEDPKRRVDECLESLDARTCREAYQTYAQRHRISTPECNYFL